MDKLKSFFFMLVVFVNTVALVASAVRIPMYPVRTPVNRFAPSQYSPYKIPVFVENNDEAEFQRAKRDHRDFDDDHFHDNHNHHHRDHDRDHHNNGGVTGPVHTFVKTDKNANYKWGVRHHVGPKYV